MDLRETLESVIDGETPPIDDTPDDTTPASTEPVAPAEPPADDSGETPGQVRDGLGRFVAKAKTVPGGAETPAGGPSLTPAGETSPGAAQAPSQAPAVPPPVGWNPAVRSEHWAKLPAAVQQEVARREAAFDHAFRQTAPVREAGEAFMRTVQPFMGAIQAEGVDPLTAVQNLLQFGARMRMGTPGEKAQTVAQIVNTYGVDIAALDAALAGVAPPPGQAQQVNVQAAVQQALAPLMQAAQQRQWQVAQEAQQHAQGELQQFAADPKHEFFADLRNDMADIIELAQRQGREVTLADAYQRAALLHPEISKVMMARRQGVNAQALTTAARNAKAAAVSVKGAAPAGNPNGAEPSSIRESIEAAIDAHSRI